MSKRKTVEDQAAVYIHYIKGCKLNTKYDRDRIIRFDDNDARSLKEWAVSTPDQRTDDPQVSK